ncbi:hypothetical protein F5B22DRAFT_654131 [Xylaria bambusicola]|uniref:uncharacterized protein n=1 Tax=Xylaria bambusicola TaxID=326684 RepID=UPI002008B45C|nr:uncharacterized protein F5B22DRAFT_654131 [Xylaria bambusicola]KAI0518249.1 hypothetical protein F5B22DRAFT_654131 [Xylaria bambusicola]
MPIRYAVPFSSPQGRRKIIRKLLVKLKHIQADDFPIPNPTIFEIKFYLKANRRCCTVFVQNTDALFYKLPLISLELVPRFITSQLEAQKIADKHRQSVQLSTVLAVLSEYIVADPIRTNSVPTLFFWYDTNKRRTFYLFAYLTHQMEPRTYSAAELLGLRRSQTSETCHSVLARLKADPEFDEVVSKGNINPTQIRAPRKPNGISSSSNESDEVIYRGKNHPRHPSQPIPPGANLQWKYRGRTGSEITSSDPLPAPTGLDKQSSEGFQRFFKAVVSPTHVRVTAGGRIVPNTRNSVSPTTKWDKERLPNDVQNAAERGKELKLEPVFAPLSNQLPPPMIQPMYQPQPMVYQHMGMPIPVYHPLQGPVQHGFAYPYGFAPLAAPIPQAPYLPMPEREQRVEVTGTMSKQNGGGGSGENNNRPHRAPIKLSPPDQFDQNRPFYINGQLVFPAGGMGPVQVPQIAPSHYFASGILPASGPSMQRMAAESNPNSGISLAAEANAPSPQLCSSAPDRETPSQQSTTATGPLPGTIPPLSSIRPSEITRKQLEGLRHQLKFYISQLQFNRHQIDEPWVFAQAQKVRDNIKQFEHNLRMHIQFEMEHYPNMEPTPRHISEMAMPSNTPSRPPSIRHTQASGSSHHGSVRSSGATSGPKHFQPQQIGIGGRGCPKPNRAAVGINSNRTDNSTAHIDALEAAVIQKLSAPDATPEQKAMLEAITRPLNPHHDPKPFVNQQYSSDNSSLKSFSIQPASFAEKKVPQGLAPSTETYLQNQRGQPAGAYHANGNIPYMTPVNGNGLTAPYLVGSCPPDTDPWSYLGHEFVYGRELTEAEKQARNIYWGKLPSKGSGLPKFDGKDFYPASPQKIAEHTGQARNVSSRRPEIDPGFELRRSEVDPFGSTRDANSIRSFESGRKLSKAIPIVAPPNVDKKTTSHLSTTNTAKSNEGIEELSKLNQSLQELNLSSTDETHMKYPEKKKSPSLSRRALERSSVKSGHDLWQTMLKKGSASGNVLPGTISSTTATGYLPQYAGNAIASLGPTISNVSPARVSPNADDKLVELEGPRVAMDKVGENCPPSSAPSIEHDITKDLHQRMLRDAERRGVIGSDWQ